MAENSNIGWTDHTLNFWRGCTKVNEGCRNCYAEVERSVKAHGVKWGPGGTRVRLADAGWRKPLAGKVETLLRILHQIVLVAGTAPVVHYDVWQIARFLKNDRFQYVAAWWQVLKTVIARSVGPGRIMVHLSRLVFAYNRYFQRPIPI